MEDDWEYSYVLDEYKDRVRKNKQDVTVFMLTHNREYYMKLTIESILKQTYCNYCLVVLDNESSDNTKNEIKKIDDERIFYIYRKSVPGDTNWMFALQHCATKYIIIIHDDDTYQPTYLETVLREIENTGYDAVSVKAQYINENGEALAVQPKESDEDKVVWSNGEYIKQWFSKDAKGIVMPSVIYRTSFCRQIDLFNLPASAGPAGDQLLWFQTERYGGTLCVLNQKLINYRIHSLQDSQIMAGYMELQLIDYLLQDNYYKTILERKKPYIIRRVWRSYLTISKRYFCSKISEEKYKEFFGYYCVNNMKCSLDGIFFYCLIRFSFMCRSILKVLLRNVASKERK